MIWSSTCSADLAHLFQIVWVSRFVNHLLCLWGLEFGLKWFIIYWTGFLVFYYITKNTQKHHVAEETGNVQLCPHMRGISDCNLIYQSSELSNAEWHVHKYRSAVWNSHYTTCRQEYCHLNANNTRFQGFKSGIFGQMSVLWVLWETKLDLIHKLGEK